MRLYQAVVSVFLAVVIAPVVLLPPALYLFGLSSIPSERFDIDTSAVPDSAVAVFWKSLGGEGEAALDRANPYSFVAETFLVVTKDQRPGPQQRLSSLAARAIMPRGTVLARRGMGNWHLSGVSASIWATRNWTAGESAAAYLNQAYYGHGFVGLDAAARGYFGVAANQLSVAEHAVLIAVLRAPSMRDPWCHPEANSAAASELVEGRVPQAIPRPVDACEEEQPPNKALQWTVDPVAAFVDTKAPPASTATELCS